MEYGERVKELQASPDTKEKLLHEIELTVFDHNGMVRVPRDRLVAVMNEHESWWHDQCCEARRAGREEGAKRIRELEARLAKAQKPQPSPEAVEDQMHKEG
jgi:hypothetical protein